MKKTVFILSLLLLPLFSSAEEFDLAKVRTTYREAVESEVFANKLFEMVKDHSDSHAILRGYEGASLMLLAKYEFNPFKKSSLFLKGKFILESIIKKNKKNIELRFLRLAVQSSAPRFLNFNSSIVDDKSHIISYYFKIEDLDLKSRIKSYAFNSKEFTTDDLKLMKI